MTEHLKIKLPKHKFTFVHFLSAGIGPESETVFKSRKVVPYQKKTELLNARVNHRHIRFFK